MLLSELIEFIPEDLTQIIEPTNQTGALYLGNISALAKSLEKYNIKSAISICEFDEYDKLNLKLDQHLVINIDDNELEKISTYFEKSNDFIQQSLNQNKNVLVHCMAGISRSATLVIAYIMQSQKMKFQQALKFVSNKRDIVYPNHGFRKQLQEYEISIFNN